jgi:hypothetical protein
MEQIPAWLDPKLIEQGACLERSVAAGKRNNRLFRQAAEGHPRQHEIGAPTVLQMACAVDPYNKWKANADFAGRGDRSAKRSYTGVLPASTTISWRRHRI